MKNFRNKLLFEVRKPPLRRFSRLKKKPVSKLLQLQAANSLGTEYTTERLAVRMAGGVEVFMTAWSQAGHKHYHRHPPHVFPAKYRNATIHCRDVPSIDTTDEEIIGTHGCWWWWGWWANWSVAWVVVWDRPFRWSCHCWGSSSITANCSLCRSCVEVGALKP